MNIETLYHIFSESNGICTDSRRIIPGSLFFALKGESFNGNRFAGEALLKGCKYVIVDDKTYEGKDRHILVKNTLETLQELANYHRKKLKIPIVAITGSNGKTTTKELCFNVLSKKFNVLATKGNLNNHIGVPITLLSIKNEEFGIIELGANHQGEIKNLCSIAEPDFGIITNIGLAHLEGFGSPEGVIRAKVELYDFIKKNKGKVFYNSDNHILVRQIKEKKVSAIPFGSDPRSICKGFIVDKSRFLHIELELSDNTKTTIRSKMVGSYNLENIVAAAAIGIYFGVPVPDICNAIENYSPSNNRSQYSQTKKNKIVLDAYNANPDSMTSSLLNFISMDEKAEKLYILGDMLELGRFSIQEHKKIIKILKENNINNVFLVGSEFSEVSENTPYYRFRNVDELVSYLVSNEVKDKMIFIKGSRGIKLEKLLDVL